MGMTKNALARAAGVPMRRINEIVLGKPSITGDTAVHLAAVLGTSERFWLVLQIDYDQEDAHHALGKSLDQIERIVASGSGHQPRGAVLGESSTTIGLIHLR
jgi:addiction module HigA family antidote